jgi:hypothetical protein
MCIPYSLFSSKVNRLSVDGGELEQVGPPNFFDLTGITSYKKTDIKTGNLIVLKSRTSINNWQAQN